MTEIVPKLWEKMIPLFIRCLYLCISSSLFPLLSFLPQSFFENPKSQAAIINVLKTSIKIKHKHKKIIISRLNHRFHTKVVYSVLLKLQPPTKLPWVIQKPNQRWNTELNSTEFNLHLNHNDHILPHSSRQKTTHRL